MILKGNFPTLLEMFAILLHEETINSNKCFIL